MSALERGQDFDSTSAGGAMRRQVREPVLVGFMLAALGTSAAPSLPPEMAPQWLRPVAQTTAGAAAVVAASAGAAIGELRRRSGLTWAQLARLFKVSRRSLHFWASGKAMARENEEHLQRLLAVVRKVDRGSASENRALLLGAQQDGSLPFDLLAEREYDRVVTLLGPGSGKAAPRSKLSAEARAVRAPRPPQELVGALQDRVHPASGRLRAAKSVRFRGGR